MDVQVRFVQLPTGAVIDLENIAAILGHELNTKYVFIPKASASPNAPILTDAEFQVFFGELEKRGLAFRCPRTAAPAPAPKVEVATS
jgi:hypothetical protein